jgi:hypothetical protein
VLALWFVERARRGSDWWLAGAAAALASIPLSGQVHLALGAIPFFLAYALVRLPRTRRTLGEIGACLAIAVGAGILMRQTVIVGSTQAGGRSLDEVRFYSARWSDFLARNVDHARSEQFVYLGWITPLVALGGLALLIRRRDVGLATVLALGALVPALLALGTHLPLYSALWHALPPFRFPRVPERLLPIACISIAALVAVAIGHARSGVVVALAIVLLFVDLHVRLYGKSTPGTPAVVAHVQPRLLELPVFDPGIHYGSVYLWYDTVAHAQRPGGYSTTAPTIAKATARRLERLNCGDWSDDTAALLQRLQIRTVAVHLGLFLRNSAVPNRTFFAWRGLVRHGWRPIRRSGTVWVFTRSAGEPGRSPVESARHAPTFCQGWYGDTGSGRFMSEEHAPFWIYGRGRVALAFAPSTLPRRIAVDGRAQARAMLRLGKPGWHLVTVDVPRLVRGPKGKKVGLELIGISGAA